MSLIGHLDELRVRLIISVAFLFLALVVCFFFARPVLQLLTLPVTRIDDSLALPPAEAASDRVVVLRIDPADGALRVKDPARLLSAHDSPDWRVEIPPAADHPTTRTLALGARRPFGSRLIYTGPLDPMMMLIRVALVMAVLVSLPVWVHQVWRFMAPGLTRKERRIVGPMLVGAIGLFPLGAAFAYAMLFLIVLVMARYTIGGVETLNSIREYLKVLTNLMIVFGFIFELPLVIAVMARVGVVTPAFLRHWRRHIYVGLAFLAAIMTPADPFSMVAALIPLIALFEISIYLAGVMALLRSRAQQEESSTA